LTPRMVSTASTVRSPDQASSASRLAACGQTNTRRRAMTVVEGIEHRRGVAGKTVPTPSPPGTPCCVEHQQVIGAPIEDLAGDRLLAAHGIQRHDAVLQRQRLEQRRDRGDLVRLAIDLTLAKRQALLTGPGADQVQWPLGPATVEGAAQGFAVNRYDLPVEGLGKGLRVCEFLPVAITMAI
jgi:hypothetical protein